MSPVKDLVVVAATAVEANAARRALPGVRVVATGVGLAELHEELGDTIISCGLAGGLRTGLESGAVLIPSAVRRPDGTTLTCDAELVQRLANAARAMGFEPVTDPLVTSATLVRGAERKAWADRGFAAVDMETGLLQARRIAVVRVVLDTPARELSQDWLRPFNAMLKPRNWPEMFWLAREAPRYAQRAALVIRAAIAPDHGSTGSP